MNIGKNPTRIKNTLYKRPEKTYTDNLTQEDIDDMLDEYKMVDDISKVPLGVHLRYCVIDKNGKKKFRVGGFLHKNAGIPKYLILTNNTTSWTVQIKNTTFFRKMTSAEVKAEYEDEIEEMRNESQKIIDKLESDNTTLKKMVKRLRKEVEYFKQK